MTDIPPESVFDSFISISPGVYDAEKGSLNGDFFKRVRSDKEPGRVADGGDFIEMKVPFEEVGIPVGAQRGADPERRVRILFSEEGSGNLAWLGNAQEGPKDNFSEEILWRM